MSGYNYEEFERLKSALENYCSRTEKVLKFEDFIKEVTEIREIVYNINKLKGVMFSPVLFRGHSNSEWNLESTLERKTNDLRVHSYYTNVLRIKPKYESFTGKSWTSNIDNLDLLIDYRFNSRFPEISDFANELPYAEYLVHLRHHGFPSPLLDWTQSPYFAAFFAFRNAKEEKAQNVSITCFIKSLTGIFSAWDGEPTIYIVPEYIKTTTRHHVQQATYTLCLKSTIKQHQGGITEKDYRFYPYKEAVNKQHGQDTAIKYIFPASDCDKILRSLEIMNINEYTLFQTEDALCKWLEKSEFNKF